MSILTARKPPSLKSRKDLAVNRAGKESIYWPLYDFLTYDTAGHSELSFFQNPIGQAGKTLADTNMTSSGQLPANQTFIINAVSCVFLPDQEPSQINLGAPLVRPVFTSDMENLMNSGYARLFIGSKDYLQMAPIGALPTQFQLAGYAALSDSSVAAVNRQSQIDYSSFAGAIHQISPLDIPSNQNFNFSMHWPTLRPLNVAGRLGVYLHGWLTRNSQ